MQFIVAFSIMHSPKFYYFSAVSKSVEIFLSIERYSVLVFSCGCI